MDALTLSVQRREELSKGVVALTLASPDARDLPTWEAGAHIDLILSDGLVRQYSLCGDPEDRKSYRVAVLLEDEGRGGSRYVHESLSAGHELVVNAPRNHFELVTADEYLFIAGGIGITPLVPMIAAVSESGKSWRLAYGGRSRQSMAFAEDLVARHGDSVEIIPQDEVGLLPLAELLGGVSRETAVYCCGPEPLVLAVEQGCARQSISDVRVERFAPKAISRDRSDESFEVELAQSGRTIIIEPDESILDGIERNGVMLDSSCRDGTCGTCEVGVLEGVVNHRDSVLSPSEQEANDAMMICVSRSCSPRLVLDL